MLNPRQRAFVRAFRECGNATEAARQAGYKGTQHALEVTGSRLLSHAEVQAELVKREERDEKHHLLRREARALLLAQIAACEVDDFEEVVTRGPEGSEKSVEPTRAKLKDRLKAIELLGKMGGDFIERREVSGPGGEPIDVKANVTLEGMVRIARSKETK